MSDIVSKTKENIESSSKQNEDVQRAKRFKKYTVLGINKKISKQVMRDFTPYTENKLISLANSVNADELAYEIKDMFGRWLLNTLVVRLLNNIVNTQRLICDSYNYLGDAIRKIFKQARNADSQYSSIISNNHKIVAETSVKLLEKLNSAFEYYDNNKKYGCSIQYALNELYSNNNETIELETSLINAKKELSIESFLKNKDNINVFDNYSTKIYNMYFQDDSNNHYNFSKVIQGHEKELNNITNYLIDKINKKTDKSVSDTIDVFIEDKNVTKMITKLIDATGATDLTHGIVKIYILKKIKDVINQNYIKLFNNIASGDSDDYKTIKMLYEQLKSLEINIIKSYRDMNEFEPNKQIEANGWIGDISMQDCGS